MALPRADSGVSGEELPSASPASLSLPLLHSLPMRLMPPSARNRVPPIAYTVAVMANTAVQL